MHLMCVYIYSTSRSKPSSMFDVGFFLWGFNGNHRSATRHVRLVIPFCWFPFLDHCRASHMSSNVVNPK